jgi:hypothetical protein
MKKQITFAANRPFPIAFTTPSHFLTTSHYPLTTPSQVIDFTHFTPSFSRKHFALHPNQKPVQSTPFPTQVLAITNLNQLLIEQTPTSTRRKNDQINPAKCSCPESSNTLATNHFSLTTLLQPIDLTFLTFPFMKNTERLNRPSRMSPHSRRDRPSPPFLVCERSSIP